MELLLPESAIEEIAQHEAGLLKQNKLYARLREIVSKKDFERTRSNWENMKSRCAEGYATLSPEFNTFPSFLRLMGFRPFPEASIHRKDNDLGYSPANCVWADKKTQARERTNAVMLTYKGETLHIMIWAERTGQSLSLMRRRRQQGWSDGEIIEGHRNSSPKLAGKNISSVFRFTPWPKAFAIEWEQTYKKKHWSGEHRLKFALRYCRERLGRLQDEIEGLWNPDEDYTGMPTSSRTPEQESEWQRLNADHERWIGWFKEFQRKISLCESKVKPSYANVPVWAERQLFKAFE